MYRNRLASRVNVTPVRSTVVLFDGGARRPSPWFGSGILASKPTHRLPCTLDDLQWSAQAFADHRFDLAQELEEMFLEAQAVERLQMGYDA
jgi:hypothetical protein